MTQLTAQKWRHLPQLLNIIAREKFINIHFNVFLRASCLEPQLLGCLKSTNVPPLVHSSRKKKGFIFNAQAFE